MNLKELERLGEFIPVHLFESSKQYDDLLESLADTVEALDAVIECLDEFGVCDVSEVNKTFRELHESIDECYGSIDGIQLDVERALRQAVKAEKQHISSLNQDFLNSRL